MEGQKQNEIGQKSRMDSKMVGNADRDGGSQWPKNVIVGIGAQPSASLIEQESWPASLLIEQEG